MTSGVKTSSFARFVGIGGSYSESDPKFVTPLNVYVENDSDFSLGTIA